MKKILFGIPLILCFMVLLHGSFFDKYPVILYISAVVSFISITAGTYLEYKKNKETFREKYLVRIIMAGFFIVITWSVALYQMFSMP